MDGRDWQAHTHGRGGAGDDPQLRGPGHAVRRDQVVESDGLGAWAGIEPATSGMSEEDPGNVVTGKPRRHPLSDDSCSPESPFGREPVPFSLQAGLGRNAVISVKSEPVPFHPACPRAKQSLAALKGVANLY